MHDLRPNWGNSEARFHREGKPDTAASWSSEEGVKSALLMVKDALVGGEGGKGDLLAGWDLRGVDDPPSLCLWERVSCDNNTFEVTGLNLSSLGLTGEISPALGQLTSLQYLDMSRNNITGVIPAEIGQCKSLQILRLSENRLEGEIPYTLGFLERLEELSLHDNKLSGPIPPSLSEIPTLKTLNLATNNLSGEIPSVLYWSQVLEVFTVRGNQLTGSISPDVCQLTSVWYFNVRENNLSGPIPDTIGNCTSFQIMDLGYNQLTGEIPVNIGFMQVSTLSLEFNRLTGRIPEVLGLMRALLILDLSGNLFEGPIPPKLGNLTFLNKLYLQGNRLSGPIPSTLGNLTRLQYLFMHDNQLTGPIPPELGRLQLFHLRLSGNRLEGSIPSNLSRCTSLNLLDLHGNLFTGSIPPEFQMLDNLTQLNLSGNFLSGIIPEELGHVLNLDTLDLSHNNLSGQVPNSVGGLEHLLALNLQGNMLSGAIPSSFGNLTSVQSIDLSFNELTGGIPEELGQLQQLTVLYLDHNNLTGSLPPSLARCFSLQDFNISYNQLHGSIPNSENFARFPYSSFLGNPNLCGSKVRRMCSWDQVKAPSTLGASSIWSVTAVAICLAALLIFAVFRAAQPKQGDVKGKSMTREGPPRMIVYHMGMVIQSYDELMRITGNLNEDAVVGQGASSKVYKCVLKSGHAVAIKKLYNHHPQNLIEFENELQMLEKIKHRNLVTLRGYSLSSHGHFLLYDYMENGSLYDVLHGPVKKIKLDWNTRLRIALGAAQGLAYLHHDCDPRIVHRDIKTCNILLDGNLDAHIADFGIARNVQHSSNHISTYVVGTIGYIDPEYARTSELNEKSDVYSYGIVLLEILTDKKAVNSDGNLLTWVNMHLANSTALSIISPEIIMSCPNLKSIEKVLQLAKLCTDRSSGKRPSMNDVVHVLLSLVSGPTLPPAQSRKDEQLQHQQLPSAKYMEMYVNPMHYKDVAGNESNSDGQLLAKFREVISDNA
ncbi:hypothetical protein R1sor_015630 [Riccia sorocarpa]|uniref:non-specific serine/threonine protein kinase n=1 Tax=Riccia sorocarpa TaxID=122646 RepID=A0ABD3HGX5_9MARC